jgi:hypothetical protein
MRTPALPSLTSTPMLRAAGLALISLAVAGCVGAGAASPSASPVASDSPSASPDPSSQTGSGFYLRASRSQALAPWNTFGWLPSVTVADGQFIDGNVAVPAIYPGPIFIQPQVRSISAAGIQAIVDEARKDGLLTDRNRQIGSPLPGGMTATIAMTVDGVAYQISGPMPTGPAGPSAEPGTEAAFGDFWGKVTNLGMWLATYLGPSGPYVPARLAVLLGPLPAEPTDSPLKPTTANWPLASTFASFGTASGTQYRCGVVSGQDLVVLLPVVQKANQLTEFVDSAGSRVSLQARALMPGEPSPCG